MSPPLPPEVELAAACCAWPPSPQIDQRVRTASERVGDWDRFDAVVRRNRINPLVQRALSRAKVVLPERTGREISARAAAASKQTLILARESLRLQRAFDEAGIPFMILKGTPLAVLAYGDLGAKESRDIDTVVPREYVGRATALLADLGYEGTLANLRGDQLEGYLAHSKEASLSRAGLPCVTELHWRLFDHSRLLPQVGAYSATQQVAVPSGQIRTLADTELFAYLCVHGAGHNWSRLKWLADIGALVAPRSQTELKQLYEATHRYGASRSASVALLLCRRLFGLEIGDELLGLVERDPVCRWLEKNALRALAYRGGGAEHELYTTAWMRVIAAPFFLVPGPAHAVENALILWNMPVDRVAINLPRRLWFLYHLVRIPAWILRFGQRMVQRAVS